MRFLFALDWHATPYGAHPLLDAASYHQWAQDIANGEWLRARAFYQSPLYPTLLGQFYALFGPNLFLASLLGAFLDSAAVALLTAFTLKHFGRMAALATLLLASFYRPMIFYSAAPMKEPLALFLLAALLPFAFRAWQENRAKDYAASGLLIGLGALTRGNFLIFAPALGLLAFWEKKNAAKNILILCGATFLALAPATIHNALASRDFVPTTYADGFNLYIGHSPIANGTNAYPPEVSTDPQQEETTASFIAQSDAGRALKPSEISAYWRGRTWNEIARNPAREFSLLKNKFEAFWNGAEKFDNYDAPFIEENFNTLLSWPLVGFGIVSTLAAFGSICAWREKNRAGRFLLFLLGVYFLSVMPFYVTDRYRLPAILFLLPLAGAALPYGVKLWRERSCVRVAAPLLLAVLFAFLALRPDPSAMDLTAFNWGTLTGVYAEAGRDAEALAALEKGIAADGDKGDIGPTAYLTGAEAAARLGHAEKATHLMDEALRLYPKNNGVHYAIGRNLAARGRIDEAEKEFEEALKLNPSHALTYYALALIAQKRGDAAKAQALVERGLEIEPGNGILRGFLE